MQKGPAQKGLCKMSERNFAGSVGKDQRRRHGSCHATSTIGGTLLFILKKIIAPRAEGLDRETLVSQTLKNPLMCNRKRATLWTQPCRFKPKVLYVRKVEHWVIFLIVFRDFVSIRTAIVKLSQRGFPKFKIQ